MRRNLTPGRGVTLTELLVVMLIIGLLSTVAIPVYINRMEDARLRLAQSEAREIAQAEEQCALMHGFYVPFQMLDDSPFIQGQTTTREDSIQYDTTCFAINPLIHAGTQFNNQGNMRIFPGSSNSRIRNMVENWSGPFLNPQRVYLGDDLAGPGSVDYPNSSWFRLDFPLDPWGEPYRFYSPIGIIGTNAYSIPTTAYGFAFSDGILTTGDDRDFERFAVVSWGRDSRPNEGGLALANSDDDIVHFFGTPGVESTFGQRL